MYSYFKFGFSGIYVLEENDEIAERAVMSSRSYGKWPLRPLNSGGAIQCGDSDLQSFVKGTAALYNTPSVWN